SGDFAGQDVVPGKTGGVGHPGDAAEATTDENLIADPLQTGDRATFGSGLTDGRIPSRANFDGACGNNRDGETSSAHKAHSNRGFEIHVRRYSSLFEEMCR